MSGRTENDINYEELLRREREKRRQEEERRRRRELLLKQVASLEASNSSILEELQENSDRLSAMLDSFEESKKKSIVELKESYINSLVTFIEEDNETENMRGGSHGVGKIACNAASDIYMMFFANCDETGKQHICK